MPRSGKSDSQIVADIAGGGVIKQMADSYGVSAPGLRQRLYRIRKSVGAKSNEHMVAIFIARRLVDVERLK